MPFCYHEAMSESIKPLIEWYRVTQRPLPFRLNRDPYRVWISEIMAQQTQIDTLIPFYLRWMERYPDIHALSEADDNDLYKLWEGLGYYSRVRNIHKTASILMKEHAGRFPSDLDSIRKLPGIGPYTAAAIASICFNEKVAAIDGNVKRVMSRLYLLDENELKKDFTLQITRTIQTWMEEVSPNELTQALMELGALVCTKQPDCDQCPLQAQCLAFMKNKVAEYPSVKPKPEKKTEVIEVLCLMNSRGQYALTLDHFDQLMKGYYRLPTRSQCDHLNLNKLIYDSRLKHVFTHKIWLVDVYRAETTDTDTHFRWVDPEELAQLPIITLHRKWLNLETL